jgi:cytochrome c oxidase subunit 1
MWGGRVVFTVPMLFSLRFIFFFVIRGLSRVMLANARIDIVLHNTYFVVGHFHYVLSMRAVFSIFARLYAICESVTRCTYNLTFAYLHFILLIIRANLTFAPMHILSMARMPKRIPDYPDKYWFLNEVASYGQIISLMSLVSFLLVCLTLRPRSKRGI